MAGYYNKNGSGLTVKGKQPTALPREGAKRYEAQAFPVLRRGNAGGQRGAAVFPRAGARRDCARASAGAAKGKDKPNTSGAPGPAALRRGPRKGRALTNKIRIRCPIKGKKRDEV